MSQNQNPLSSIDVKDFNYAKKQANNYLALGYPKQAAIIYINIIQFHNGNLIISDNSWFEIYTNLSKTYNTQGNYSSALWWIDKAIMINPKAFTGYANKACYLFNIKCYNEVIKYCDKALALDSSYFGYYCKAGALQQLERYDEAINNFNLAIKCCPYKSDAYKAKTNLLIKLDKAQEAYEFLKSAIQIYNLDGYILDELLGKCLWKLGENDLAINYIDKAIYSDKAGYESFKIKGEYLSSYPSNKTLENSLKYLNKAIELAPEMDLELYKLTAGVLFSLGYYTEIVNNYLKQLLNPEQDFDFGYKCVIECYKRLEDEGSAKKLQEEYDRIKAYINYRIDQSASSEPINKQDNNSTEQSTDPAKSLESQDTEMSLQQQSISDQPLGDINRIIDFEDGYSSA
jgi:tetratricopeptide (TPR) repeat protein